MAISQHPGSAGSSADQVQLLAHYLARVLPQKVDGHRAFADIDDKRLLPPGFVFGARMLRFEESAWQELASIFKQHPRLFEQLFSLNNDEVETEEELLRFDLFANALGSCVEAAHPPALLALASLIEAHAPEFLEQANRHGLIATVRSGSAWERWAAAIITAVVAGMPIVVSVVMADGFLACALKVFAVLCLSFLPGWLFIRFLGQRAGALWSEYVLHLHRLGWDRTEYLPRPPRSSCFFLEWLDSGGYLTERQGRTIYQLKFDAYYGKSVSETFARSLAGTPKNGDYSLHGDTLFPVFMATAVMAVGWSVVVHKVNFIDRVAAPELFDMLKFAFIGAYIFTAQDLLRRFFQSDLRASAYVSAVLRIFVALVTTTAIYEAFRATAWSEGQWELVAAFVAGIFPVIFLKALYRLAARTLAGVNLIPDERLPLYQLDGLNVWYQNRFIELGIEDIQNMASMKLVDVMLHTRAPVERLVDWLDQSLLYVRLDSPDDRAALRRFGIRTATDLLKAFPPDQVDPRRGVSPVGAFEHLGSLGNDFDVERLRTLVRILHEDDRLAPIWNWQKRGVQTKVLPYLSRSESDPDANNVSEFSQMLSRHHTATGDAEGQEAG
ncbi:hypothetical protein [Smaragdicoccus niigatensis]|uniref:hypothetical protein n=1 Tax=Smaragdicoccus niigatensis TaxID=359359 RepID=UPI00035D9660|nr:hypothetical protein [Smaragdicoccus niigatensis]